MSSRYEIKGENIHGGNVSAWTSDRARARTIMKHRKKAGWLDVHIIDHDANGGPTRIR